MDALWIALIIAGTAAIVWGAERFSEHLAVAAVGLGVTAFALALLLAGAEPEELATTVAASARDAPGIAFGDVVGANVAICLVALGVGAVRAPLPFGKGVRPYVLAGLPIVVIGTALMWDGRLDRIEGLCLVLLYAVYVAAIWIRERRPPSLGETAEITEGTPTTTRRFGRELGLVLLGLTAMVAGALVLVEAVRRLTGAEDTQTVLGLTLVGFATAFELVVLAWSASRRGISEATVAAVVGSLTYNVTMTIGAAALVRPLRLADVETLRPALVMMVAAVVVVTVLGTRRGTLDRRDGIILLSLYPVFVVLVLVL